MRTDNTKTANQVKPILKILVILAILVQTIALNACSSGDDGEGDNTQGGISSSGGGDGGNSLGTCVYYTEDGAGVEWMCVKIINEDELNHLDPSIVKAQCENDRGARWSNSSTCKANPVNVLECTDGTMQVDFSLYEAAQYHPLTAAIASCQDAGMVERGGSVYAGGGGKGNDISNYNTVTIGAQVWMAENLNYDIAGSKCYGEGGKVWIWNGDDDEYITLSNAEIQANCDTYGRLYDWATAMALPSSCNRSACSGRVSAKHRGICPEGWHIPSNDDWEALYRSAVVTETPYSNDAGKYLKATSGWDWNDMDDISGNGLDTYGFAALPGGWGVNFKGFDDAGRTGAWWSSSEHDEAVDTGLRECSSEYDSFYAYINNHEDRFAGTCDGKAAWLSVRCVRD